MPQSMSLKDSPQSQPEGLPFHTAARCKDILLNTTSPGKTVLRNVKTLLLITAQH